MLAGVRLAAAITLAAAVLMTTTGNATAGVRSGTAQTAVRSAGSAELDTALDEDGRFVGASRIDGNIDLSQWRLVSDLAAGEPPRFAPATTTAVTTNAWNALGSNGSGNGAVNNPVRAILIQGTDLYIGGDFTSVAGIAAASYIARWNGSAQAWQALPGPGNTAPFIQPVNAILSFNNELIVGGEFSNAGGDALADYLALWNGASWSHVGSPGTGNTALLGSYVYSLTEAGGKLFVGGQFINVNGISTWDYMVIWDVFLNQWRAPFPAPACPVYALASTVTDVYAGGCFTNLGGNATADYVARLRLSDETWFSMGSNGSKENPDGALNGAVRALAISGTNVYVGGDFTDAVGNPTLDYVGLWNGSQWLALGSNGSGNGAINARVYAIAVSGSDVFVGGNFTNAGNNPTADRAAKFSGGAWSNLGSNGTGDGALNQFGLEPPGWVRALAVTSSELYVGGSYQNAGNVAEADRIAVYGLGSAGNQKPDGRIKKGSGSYVGNNIYNTDGTNQIRQGSAGIGSTITFTISIQNDGTGKGKFLVAAVGAAITGYRVKFLRGTTDITSAVVAATYTTPKIAVGSALAIKAKVKVLDGALSGSSITRLVTITSVANGLKIDAVKFIGKRK